ncbi:serine protease [Pilimelia anulata]|uniref:Serine protease n=1 Tax=Pilimelia anulata TaxID=53371 RepID=A0A8J3BBR9_9ACTN|nr:serine protease [Pilimelia anulata]GGK03387.1 serine protease [Pilimelia anulata]
MKIAPRIALAALAAAALAAGAVAVPAAADPGSNRIVGGKVTTEKWPFTGSLGGCGSALIHEKWIVTAAHCTSGGGGNVRLDSNNKNSGGEVVRVTRYTNHPQYRTIHDIAVGELASPAKTPPIPIAAAHPTVGTKSKLLGWGATTASGGSPSSVLKELDTSMVDAGRCRGISQFDPSGDICTDNPGGNQGACFGDSGGPQISQVDGKWVLIGVTSRGEQTCARNPSIYTSVPAHLSWIKQATGGAVGG